MEGLKLRVSLLRSHKLEPVPRVVPLILAVHGAIHHDLAPIANRNHPTKDTCLVDGRIFRDKRSAGFSPKGTWR